MISIKTNLLKALALWIATQSNTAKADLISICNINLIKLESNICHVHEDYLENSEKIMQGA